MKTGSDYEFVSTDGKSIETDLISLYQSLTGRTVRAASPERLFIQWVTAAILQERIGINHAGNQNIPSRATGENLDALGELYYIKSRPTAKPASVRMLFAISESLNSATIIPAGTRVSSGDGSITFITDSDVMIPTGELEVEIQCSCETSGTVGNGYEPGTINICVDPFPYFDSCTNIDTSDGGADTATDEEYYELMTSSDDAYSCAGSYGAYKYFAKSASTNIADVVVNTPSPAQVSIYVIMNDGKAASEEVRLAVLKTCNADEVRPLTDKVVVEDPEFIPFDVNFTYYINQDSENSASTISADVEKAVQDYVSWQCAKIGRDINPSKLIQMVIAAGAKRVEIIAPSFVRLNDGSDNQKPQFAQVGSITVVNGGYEDE